MRTGSLRHRITIQRLTSIKDKYGSPVEKWVDGPTIWAEMTPNGQGEKSESQQTIPVRKVTITMRYRVDIGMHDRLYYRTRNEVWNIKDIQIPNDPSLLRIEAETGLNNG